MSTRAERGRKYYETHREEIILRVRKWYAKNRASRKVYNRKYHQANREYLNGKIRQYQQRIRQEVIEHYGGCCTCCGETQIKFLSIDHTNGGGTKQRRQLNKRGVTFCLWIQEQNYPSYLRVLCHNCNQAIGLYKGCPHKENIENGKAQEENIEASFR